MKNINLKVVKSYKNAYDLKNTIFMDNAKKSGVYRWINNFNGNTYVGSGIDLTKRLRSYFNENELHKNPRPISDAILKYKMNNFTLEILEYCSKHKLIETEQYYLNLLTPEYNVLRYAYSLLGFKHKLETIEKLKSRVISEEHKKLLSSIHKGKTVSEETKNRLSIASTNYKKDNPLTPEALENITNKTIKREGIPVSVLNTDTNELKTFTNQTEAGRYLGVSRQAIFNAINRNSKINKIYVIEKQKKNS